MVHDLLPLDRLGTALAERLGDDAWRDVDAELISGGKSNLTFVLSSSAGELILRRPPTGELLPSAHDMGREARVQQALGPTAVPTARIVFHDPGDLIGIQCYVMEKVPGHVIREALPAGYASTEAERRTMARTFVRTLADLHALDPEAVGLGDYGRPTGYLERQVRRWGGQWEASRTHDVPELDELRRRLAANIPPQQRSTIVHGDFRIDNVVYDAEDAGRVNAVLDWELSTLGDPLTDLGLLTLFWREAGEEQFSLIPGITHLPGFLTREEVLATYAEASGTDLADMAYYQAFAHFKFAVIAQGVSARSAAGAMGGQDFGNLDAEILALARDGLELI
ncbi:phosphotransferase family protein [Nocardioides sp. zg-536]|uniref:Phosphotransferase family protein n=1 Tax=Nocardioides faecalis TaxID=2803858 RepID=A0A939BUE4_9ACTN|nr:phosphotransferase family protein [Nocardioides faecalis]MBM9461589.1 phosphotransferase family protein [Nocardioides faecalis]QVI57778.1 phosphotransferase family protein [Nocardioides faecalis]